MKKNQLRIDILGTTFAIQSEEKPEYLKALYDFLKRKISDTKQNSPASDPLKIALLACLNCIDELFKERERSYSLKNARAREDVPEDKRIINEEIDEVTARIIKKIDESIAGMMHP